MTDKGEVNANQTSRKPAEQSQKRCIDTMSSDPRLNGMVDGVGSQTWTLKDDQTVSEPQPATNDS